jgi:hypothetical protein
MEMLVEYLNTTAGRAKQKPVSQLLASLHELELLLWKEPPTAQTLVDPEGWTRERKREDLEKQVNDTLIRYRFRPVIGADYRLHVYWLIANKPRISKTQMAAFRSSQGQINKTPLDETAAIQIVLELATSGDLTRVRQCRCNRWFLATTTKKVVCSDACRFNKYRERDEFKEQRRKYMREYMRDPEVKQRRSRNRTYKNKQRTDQSTGPKKGR